MTALVVPSPDIRRRFAVALATLVAALAVPASAQALTYCVTPATGGCAQSFPTRDRALAAADGHPGTDIVRVREGAATHDIQVPAPAAGGTKGSGPSFPD